ncbi:MULTISPECIES: tetratricopeptide repeat protein [Ignavibacterium]|uniref:tetratricopeptide repeat protein n=1 Tax=Ignavibacterium TaxID=795750 RepID=UPI0025C45AAC|nr:MULTISPECIES: tetratricopeptide repeat protein [Ignavibacterium]
MFKSSSEIFNEKVSLIYEYNKQTPLFVRMANIHLEKNNPQEALIILNAGLIHYPDHPVAIFLIAKAHTALGNYSQAIKFLKKGSELIHSPKTYEFYLREIEAIKKQKIFYDVDRTSGNETSLSEKEKDLTSVFLTDTVKKIAEELKEAEEVLINPDKENFESQTFNPIDNSLILSETLAKIYINQREYQEAIRIYEKLKIKIPEKSHYFDSKIDELKLKLETDQV